MKKAKELFKTVLALAFIFLLPIGYIGAILFPVWIKSLRNDIVQLRHSIQVLEKEKEDAEFILQKKMVNKEAYEIFLQKGMTEDGLRHLLTSAESGYIEAVRTLAPLYRDGRYFAKDEETALYWYRIASEAGDGQSMLALGDMYYARAKFKDAWHWYSRALHLGILEAAERQAGMYEKGQYVPRCPSCAEDCRMRMKAGQFIEFSKKTPTSISGR